MAILYRMNLRGVVKQDPSICRRVRKAWILICEELSMKPNLTGIQIVTNTRFNSTMKHLCYCSFRATQLTTKPVMGCNWVTSETPWQGRLKESHADCTGRILSRYETIWSTRPGNRSTCWGQQIIIICIHSNNIELEWQHARMEANSINTSRCAGPRWHVQPTRLSARCSDVHDRGPESKTSWRRPPKE